MFFNLSARISYFLADFWPYLILIFVSSALFLLAIYKIFKSELSFRNKKIGSSIIFTFLILIFTFAVFETYFRYIYDQSDGLGFLKVNERWHKRHVIYNNYFFRDRDFSLVKKEGVVRIGVLGDSIAFGAGIKNVDDRFSNILERKLSDNGFNVEIYNLGTPGYDTEGEIQKYQNVKHLNFGIIIWEYFLNDIQPLEKSTGTPIISKNSQQDKVVKFLSDRSFFFDFIYWRFSTRYKKTFEELKQADLAQYQNEQVLKKHKEDIAAFIKELHEADKKIVIIIFPFVHLIGPGYPAEKIHQEMSSYFRSLNVDVIDLLGDLKEQDPKTLVASEFDPHPNEYVHALAAERPFKSILPLLK